MKIMKTATVLGTVALSLALAACGSEKSQAPSGPAPTSSTGVDDKLAAMVPAAIKSDGKIVIGTDSTYAPSEFLDTDGKTVIGFDVDLFNAVAKKLGLTTEWQSGDFGSLIAGVASGKYETSVSSFTVNADREKNANMVSYFSAGTQWAAPTGKTVDPNNACGLKVAVQTNTVQVDDLTMKSKACTAAGKKPITIEQFQDQGAATAAVASGKTDAMLADSPVVAYAVKKATGLQLAGDIYDSAPYGYVIAKDQTDLANAIKGAVQDLIDDGTYKQILEKWGVEAGAIPTAQLNPAS